jgi:hypothetical protein
MQEFLGVVGFLTFCVIYCWFPETTQPGFRGIDKMRAKDTKNAKGHFYFINPLRPLLLLRSLMLLLIVSALCVCTRSFSFVNPHTTLGDPRRLSVVIFGTFFLAFSSSPSKLTN